MQLLAARAGLTPYHGLAASTRNVAEFPGTADSAGTIAVGKRADLILLTANPLLEVGHTRQRAGVMVGGHWRARGARPVSGAIGAVGFTMSTGGFS